MGQDHDAAGERAEAELVGGEENLASATDGTSTMTDAELRRNDEDVVVFLLVAELLEHACRLGRLPETLGTELAVVVVVEVAGTGLPDHVEHLLHSLVVGRGDLLPLRDGEPSFSIRGKRLSGGPASGVIFFLVVFVDPQVQLCTHRYLCNVYFEKYQNTVDYPSLP